MTDYYAALALVEQLPRHEQDRLIQTVFDTRDRQDYQQEMAEQYRKLRFRPAQRVIEAADIPEPQASPAEAPAKQPRRPVGSGSNSTAGFTPATEEALKLHGPMTVDKTVDYFYENPHKFTLPSDRTEAVSRVLAGYNKNKPNKSKGKKGKFYRLADNTWWLVGVPVPSPRPVARPSEAAS